MTMDLFILRHGEAGKRGASRGHDSKRPPTAAGEKEITTLLNLSRK
jgi:phosphohistidine phosphatase SixA